MGFTRFDENPLITEYLFPSGSSDGLNINGPSVIQVPDWVSNPLGKYYMYFSHHNGDYIRLSYAKNINGPWSLTSHRVLSLNETPCFGHIASPDVIVDHDNRSFIMYFHGKSKSSLFPGHNQLTFVSQSKDGISFCSQREPVAPFYLRVFQIQNQVYGVAKNKNKGGYFLRAKSYISRFEIVDEIIPRMRHASVLPMGDGFSVFYSLIGDRPESIFQSFFRISKEKKAYQVGPSFIIVSPEEVYEGAKESLTFSKSGTSKKAERAVRDPFIFPHSSRLYLFYSAAGEKCICGGEILLENLNPLRYPFWFSGARSLVSVFRSMKHWLKKILLIMS